MPACNSDIGALQNKENVASFQGQDVKSANLK